MSNKIANANSYPICLGKRRDKRNPIAKVQILFVNLRILDKKMTKKVISGTKTLES